MGGLHLVCVMAGLACAGAALDARAQALRGYEGGDGDSGQAALRGYVPPAPSSDDGSQSSGNDNDWPRDADDDRRGGRGHRDHSDHSLPAGPQYDSPQEDASAQPVYAPQPAYVPPPDPVDTARANCAALHQRLEAVMRAEMQGGNPAAMKQYAAERAAIYQQEMQTGCQ